MGALQTNARISINNILVTTDFSQTSKNALPFATALARQYEAKIIVAHALSPEPHLSVPVDPLPKDADPAFLGAQEANLHKFADPQGVMTEGHILCLNSKCKARCRSGRFA